MVLSLKTGKELYRLWVQSQGAKPHRMTYIHESLLLTCVRTIEVFDHAPIFIWANCDAIIVDLRNILAVGIGQEPLHFDDETEGEILTLVGFLFEWSLSLFSFTIQ